MLYFEISFQVLIKFVNNKNFLKIILLLNIVVLFYFIIFYNNLKISSNNNNKVSKTFVNNYAIHSNQFSTVNTTREIQRILIVTNSRNSSITNELIIIFESFRYSYKIFTDKTLLNNPRKLSSFKYNFFSLIIIDSVEVILDDKYFEIKRVLLNAATHFNLGLIIFLSNNQRADNLERYSSYFTLNPIHNQIEITFKPISQIKKCNLNKFSISLNNFYHITKFNDKENILEQKDEDQKIVWFNKYDTKIYESVLNCSGYNGATILKSKDELSKSQRILLIGIDLNQLLISASLLIDFISFASNGIYKNENKRFIQIDIDDIFVGAKNTRMLPEDVRCLIDFQENVLNKKVFNSSVEKFKFNLGFSGYYYQSGNEKENEGDQLLIGEYKYL
jgi:hypothetical protein